MNLLGIQFIAPRCKKRCEGIWEIKTLRLMYNLIKNG